MLCNVVVVLIEAIPLVSEVGASSLDEGEPRDPRVTLSSRLSPLPLLIEVGESARSQMAGSREAASFTSSSGPEGALRRSQVKTCGFLKVSQNVEVWLPSPPVGAESCGCERSASLV